MGNVVVKNVEFIIFSTRFLSFIRHLSRFHKNIRVPNLCFYQYFCKFRL